MNLFFADIREFFTKKSVYRVLFMVLVFFYAVFFIVGTTIGKKHLPEAEPPSVEVQILSETMLDAELVTKRIAEHPEYAPPVQTFFGVFTALFFIGIFLEFRAVRHFRLTGDFFPDSGFVSLTSWNIGDILKVTILFFSAALLLNMILGLVYFMAGKGRDEITLLIHAAAVDLAAVWFIVRTAQRSGSKVSDLFGWRWVKIPWREIGLGIQTYVTIFPTLLALIVVLVIAANLFSYEPPAHPLVHIFMKERALPPWALVFSIFLACVIGPVVEEIFFRGFFYPALRRYFASGWAMAATAALFALVHENLFSFIPIFFLGFALCYLYEKRASIVAPIALHITHNTIFLSYFFIVKRFLVDAS